MFNLATIFVCEGKLTELQLQLNAFKLHAMANGTPVSKLLVRTIFDQDSSNMCNFVADMGYPDHPAAVRIQIILELEYIYHWVR